MIRPQRFRPVVALGLWVALVGTGSLPAGGAVASLCDPSLPVDEERASRILAEGRPFAPTNRYLFFTFDHPDSADTAPLENIDGPGLTETETREALRAFLARRFPCAPDRVGDGLAVYGDPVARQEVPDPTLRAALAALTGTVGEPAISFLLYRTPVTLVNFGIYVEPDVGFPGRVAGAGVAPDQTRFIVIDRRFRFVPFAAFSALLFHEALHTGADDDTAGLPEEAVATAFEALVYMEMLLTDPNLATLPDELTRINNNHIALVRLNSGAEGTDRLTLFAPGSDVNVDPLAAEPLTEFYEYYAFYSAPDDPDFRLRETQGNWLLQEVLTMLAEPGEKLPAGADFDAETVEFVDHNQAVLSPAELIAVACILRARRAMQLTPRLGDLLEGWGCQPVSLSRRTLLVIPFLTALPPRRPPEPARPARRRLPAFRCSAATRRGPVSTRDRGRSGSRQGCGRCGSARFSPPRRQWSAASSTSARSRPAPWPAERCTRSMAPASSSGGCPYASHVTRSTPGRPSG